MVLPSLVRLVILGADIARPDVLTSWQHATDGKVRLVNSYGLTETTIVATVWEATREELGDSWRAVPIGYPLRNVSAYVLDARSELVPIGVPGEICIGGLAVASCYLGDDALTTARFVPDPFLPGQRMYRTGDRGRLRPCGGLEFLGRVDYQLKVGGVRVELGEIEGRLREVPVSWRPWSSRARTTPVRRSSPPMSWRAPARSRRSACVRISHASSPDRPSRRASTWSTDFPSRRRARSIAGRLPRARAPRSGPCSSSPRPSSRRSWQRQSPMFSAYRASGCSTDSSAWVARRWQRCAQHRC